MCNLERLDGLSLLLVQLGQLIGARVHVLLVLGADLTHASVRVVRPARNGDGIGKCFRKKDPER